MKAFTAASVPPTVTVRPPVPLTVRPWGTDTPLKVSVPKVAVAFRVTGRLLPWLSRPLLTTPTFCLSALEKVSEPPSVTVWKPGLYRLGYGRPARMLLLQPPER